LRRSVTVSVQSFMLLISWNCSALC